MGLEFMEDVADLVHRDDGLLWRIASGLSGLWDRQVIRVDCIASLRNGDGTTLESKQPISRYICTM